jgi:ribose 5-phosphate isomerase A
MTDQDLAKQAAAQFALTWVQPHMILGLGSGSTIGAFIRKLGPLCRQGLPIRAVASSVSSQTLAEQEGIVVEPLETVHTIDLTVDGADAIDTQFQVIKGKGGAHTREKILARASRSWLLLIDPTKQVEDLSHTPVPVEILPFGSHIAANAIQSLGFHYTWRRQQNQTLYITDNQNYLLDLSPPLPHPIDKIDPLIRSIPGVISTGIFLSFHPTVAVGFPNGTCTILLKDP